MSRETADGNQFAPGVRKTPGLRALRWSASIAAMVAALLVASNTAATKWGFVVFAIASALWIAAGLADRIYSLATLNVGLLVINLFGIWRWFT